MQVSNNPSKVIFYRPSNPFEDNQQLNTRSSSFYKQRGIDPILIKDPSIQNKQVTSKQKKAPKKVSFHYSNGPQTSSNVLIYPPSFPIINNLNGQSVENRKRFQSEYSRNSKEQNNKQRMRIFSTDQKSQVSKNSAQNVVRNSTFHKLGGNKPLNYPPNKLIKQQSQNVKNQQQFLRQRSDSILSSKSSTKIIRQTVRQVNPDGSKGLPVEFKQRIQTQYQTNVNNRQNYHAISNQSKKICLNQQSIKNPQPFVRNFYSPQNSSSFGILQQNQRINGQYLPNKNQVRSNQLVNTNAKSSQVFCYPIKGSFQNKTHLNNLHSNINQSNNQGLRSYPITSQSKFQQTQKLEYQKINPNETRNIKPNGNNTTKVTQIVEKQISKSNQVKVQDKNSSKYAMTTEFYSISQKTIDQIFRNQTEKALLKFNTIEYQQSPRRFHSPNIKRYSKN